MRGKQHTDESRRAISESRKGKGGGPRSAERRARISAALKGRAVTPEQRAAIAKTLTGRKQSPETIEKRARKLRGRAMPEGFSEAVSARMTGRRLPPEHRQSIGRSKAKLTDEQVRQIRRRAESGELQRTIAAEYGVDQSVVSEIRTGKSYRWVA